MPRGRPRSKPIPKPIPKLSATLADLPSPEDLKRDKLVMLRFNAEEFAMIESAAKARGEPESQFLRALILTVFQNTAAQALGQSPQQLRELTPTELQKALLKVFDIK